MTPAMSTDSRFAAAHPVRTAAVCPRGAIVCADAALTASLAGSLFFRSPTSAARGKILLYLLLTMAPFAIVAPVMGPALDRIKGGRRLLIVASAAAGPRCASSMAQFITKPAPEGLLVYPLAFGVLVLAKSYQMAKQRARSRRSSRTRASWSAPTRGSRSSRSSRHGGRRAGGLHPAALRRRLVAAARRDRVRDRRGPRGEDPAHPARPEARRAPGAARDAGAAPAEHPARRQRDGRDPQAASASCCSSPRSRSRTTSSRSASSASRARLGGFVGVIARARAAGSVREEVIVASALGLPAVFVLLGALLGGGVGFALAAMAVATARPAGGSGSTACSSATARRGARSRVRAVRDAVPVRVGHRGAVGIIPFARDGRPVPPRDRARLRGDLLRRGLARGAAARTADEAPPEAVDRDIVRSTRHARSERCARGRSVVASGPTTRNPSRRRPDTSADARRRLCARRLAGTTNSVGEVDAGEPEAGGVELGRRRQHRLALPQPVQAVGPGPLDDAAAERLRRARSARVRASGRAGPR